MRPSLCAIQLKGGQGAPHGDTGDGTSSLRKAEERSVSGRLSGVNTLALSGVGSASSDGTNAALGDLSTNVCVQIGSLAFPDWQRPT